MKETEILVPEIVQPACKQLRLVEDDDDATSYFTSADTSAQLITSSQLQSTIVDEHNILY